jgi:iron transport multicopper oxidase
MPELLLSYLSPENSDGIEPAPNTTILNDSPGPLKLSVTPGKTYRVRIINVSNMASNQIWIQDHNFTVIAVDGVNVQAATNVQSLYIATAQRVDILFTAKKTTNQNYFFISMLDEGMYGDPTTIDVPNAFGYLVYNPALPLPETFVPEYVPFLDDTTLVPYDLQPILAPVTNTIHLSVLFVDDDNDINRYASNISSTTYMLIILSATITTERQTYVPPLVPTLYTVLSAPAADVMDPLIYGNGTNPFVVSYGDM